MASGEEIKWPGPVTFDDEEPKKGYFRITLTLKEMKTKRVIIGKATSKNTTFNGIPEMFTKEALWVRGKVTLDDGNVQEYEYKKPLPEDIKPELCSYKLKGDQISLNVCKAESVSWAQHAKYLIMRSETKKEKDVTKEKEKETEKDKEEVKENEKETVMEVD